MKVLVFGAGAVGSSVGGWLASVHPDVWLLDLPKVIEPLKANGLTLFLGEAPEQRTHVKVKTATALSEVERPDLVILAVKTYSLEKVSELVKAAYGDAPLILALQNGVDNQDILPRFFTRVVYGIVSYNCWIQAPGEIGYQKKGPLVLGTPDNTLRDETRAVAELLNRGVETHVTSEFQSAAHAKMIVNLTNSLTTLIGHPLRPVTDRALFQKVLTHLTYEGVCIARASGFKEVRLGGMPPWWLMTAAAKLPRVLTKRAFEKNVKKMVMSSMAQDVLQRGGHDTELETLNGHFLRLADRAGLAVPYNRAVYKLCKARFAEPVFQPMTIEEVHAAIA